jgi:hypothetical protein
MLSGGFSKSEEAARSKKKAAYLPQRGPSSGTNQAGRSEIEGSTRSPERGTSGDRQSRTSRYRASARSQVLGAEETAAWAEGVLQRAAEHAARLRDGRDAPLRAAAACCTARIYP